MQGFFESMARQNYTNFHIVYVDDMSPDGSLEAVLQYLADRGSFINNRIRIVHNLQRVGTMGNLYLWINKYCNEGDVVIHVDADDSVIGSQTLRVLNEAYKDPNIWYVYSQFIIHQSGHSFYEISINRKLSAPTS